MGYSTVLLDEAMEKKRKTEEARRLQLLEKLSHALEALSREIPFEEAVLFGSVTAPFRFSDQKGGDHMEKERIAILKAEIEAQSNEIEKIYGRLDERSKKRGKAAAESIGYQLHNLYCAFEDLFGIVAKTFENNIHDKGRYHLELLKRMTLASLQAKQLVVRLTGLQACQLDSLLACQLVGLSACRLAG